jgi:hypothetical protein
MPPVLARAIGIDGGSRRGFICEFFCRSFQKHLERVSRVAVVRGSTNVAVCGKRMITHCGCGVIAQRVDDAIIDATLRVPTKGRSRDN